MTARMDDLSTLLAPAGSSELDVLSGTVTSWNPATGENSVHVHSVTLTDLPVLLNAGAPVSFAVADVVTLLRVRSVYIIVGIVAAPGSAPFDPIP